jgi:CheY-like chemotaxis protein
MTGGASPVVRRLLLVDDSFGDAMLAEEAMNMAAPNVRLLRAADAEEALAMLRREPPHGECPRPDLVLLDLNLPRMSGLALLRAIRTDAVLAPLPVIVMTGSVAMDDVREAYAAGANCYIVKPMRFEELVETIEAINRFWFDMAALPVWSDAVRSDGVWPDDVGAHAV